MKSKVKNKIKDKIKVELTSHELQIIIDLINAWNLEDNLWIDELDLLKKLIKIKKENEN